MLQSKLTTIPLGFINCGESGKLMLEKFTTIYEDFAIDQNKLFITTDNCKELIQYVGSSNKTFIDHMKIWSVKKKIEFNPKMNWIRCGCHSLNLSVVCKLFIILDFLEEISSIISLIQDLVVKIRGSRRLVELLHQKIKTDFPKRKISRLIVSNLTRWGSTFLMVSRFLFLKNQIIEIIEDVELKRRYDLGSLTEENWRMFEIVYFFLKEYYRYNLLLESATKPTIHYSTEAYTSLYSHCMFWIEELDGIASNNLIISGIIKSANILTKYFNLGTLVHFASSIFDPRMKMYIYESNFWQKQATEMIQE